MQSLQIEKLPLQPGIRLIEASAGTGKTYTIANLYLRLLLQQQRSVEEILVVTFTEAATFELRERIRKRLHDAMHCLRSGSTEALAGDSLLADMVNADNHARYLQQLQDALIQIDEASIFTIHGFCTRVLAEHAFESGVPFEMEFIGDEYDYLIEVVQDFWRSQSYTLQGPLLGWWLNWAKSPPELFKRIRPLLVDDLVLIPEAQDSEKLLSTYARCYQRFSQQLRLDDEALKEYLLHSPDLKRNIYKVDTLQQLLDELQHVNESEVLIRLPKNFFRLTHESLEKALKKGTALKELKLYALADELWQLNQALDQQLAISFQHQARDYVRTHLQQQKQRNGVLAFDDLLRHMDRALQGQHAEHLISVLNQRYPCAMIDEFQDTDAMQYRIFNRIYAREGSLYLIGDPKQAIYSFRNADIFTYMQAKRATLQQPDSGFTLDINWRSSSAMVAGVNQLFDQAQAPFIYDDDIPFHPVRAAAQQGQADQQPLVYQEQAMAALQWWLVEDDDGKGIKAQVYDPQVMAACCDEVVRLLNAAQQGELLLGDRALQAQDIAFLVRKNKQGFALQEMLAQRGVGSVFVKRESVYQSYEADELLILIQAVLHYRVDEGIRAALATSLLAFSATQIDDLLRDETRWEAMLERFATLHQIWQQHGFMRMFHQLLQDFAVVATLRGDDNSDRRLTNLLHLSELIAQLEQESYGVEALLRAYEEAMDAADSERESEQLRLENEANLVTIITIHKSKGLQYPVVFLPFAARGDKPGDELAFHHPQYGRCRDLGSSEQDASRRAAHKEALAEDIRLFYVALTRAEQRCYLPLGKAHGYEHTALAYLLHGDAAKARLASAEIGATLRTLYKEHDGVDIAALPAALGIDYHGEPPVLGRKPIRQFERSLQLDWWVTSYSYLTSNRHGLSQDYEQGVVDVVEPEADVAEEREPVFEFPRGAQAGQCLHSIFENIAFADARSWPEVVTTFLQRYGFEAQWQDTVLQMLENVLACELDGQGLSLQRLQERQRLNEMAIYFPIARLQAEQLNDYLQNHSYGPRRPLQFQQIQGMMKGFIDLVFEFDGRFYIVDYKSNHLGDRLANYEAAGLERAILEHDYDLQYLIYSLALHRYLRLRMPDYDYEQHFGGVYYLFLRGMRQGLGAQYGVHRARPSLMDIEALEQLLCGGVHG